MFQTDETLCSMLMNHVVSSRCTFCSILMEQACVQHQKPDFKARTAQQRGDVFAGADVLNYGGNVGIVHQKAADPLGRHLRVDICPSISMAIFHQTATQCFKVACSFAGIIIPAIIVFAVSRFKIRLSKCLTSKKN